MKLFFICATVLIIIYLFMTTSPREFFSPDYEKIADKITAGVAKKLEQEKKLRLVGTGGRMMKDIQAMNMSFHFFKEVNLNEARNLIIYAVTEYLSAINSNQDVRPYLSVYPFTAQNVEIRIWIYKPDRSRLAIEKIYYISAIDGMLKYYIRDSDQLIHKETYEEALKQVNTNILF